MPSAMGGRFSRYTAHNTMSVVTAAIATAVHRDPRGGLGKVQSRVTPPRTKYVAMTADPKNAIVENRLANAAPKARPSTAARAKFGASTSQSNASSARVVVAVAAMSVVAKPACASTFGDRKSVV